MNENLENMILSDEEQRKIMADLIATTKPRGIKYQYSHVDMETVIANPNEFIIPQCLPACKTLWEKNIETFMVSNNDDKDLYVLFDKLSDENIALFQQLTQSDSRFFFDGYRKTYGIRVKGNDERAARELADLVEELRMQDTLRFKTVDDFLEEFKTKSGEMGVDEYGYIYSKQNPELANVTLQEALKRSGKENLYVASEGRVYDSPLYLSWHERYQQALSDSLKFQVSELGSNRDNTNEEAALLRDIYLEAEREYISELIKQAGMRQLIEEVNQMPSETLFNVAQKIINNVENGQIPDEQMERVEKQLTVLLAAIHDKVLIKGLIETYDELAPSKKR